MEGLIKNMNQDKEKQAAKPNCPSLPAEPSNQISQKNYLSYPENTNNETGISSFFGTQLTGWESAVQMTLGTECKESN